MVGTRSPGHGTATGSNTAAGSSATAGPDAAPETELAAIAQMGPGKPLDAAAARAAATLVGQPPGDVTVHIGPEAERFAAQHQARAVTVGSHIAFAAGQYRPGTPDGDQLIAHELAHVIQMR